MRTSEELEKGLRQFYGTEQYHKIGNIPIVATDGVMWFVKQTNTNWLISDIVMLCSNSMDTESFILVQVVSDGENAKVSYFNGDDEKLHEDNYENKNLPMGTWRFYVKDGVILLPQEY